MCSPGSLKSNHRGSQECQRTKADYTVEWVAFAGGHSLHGIQLGTDSWDLLESFLRLASLWGSQGIFVSMDSSERDVQLSL